jgi:hypothetical protein
MSRFKYPQSDFVNLISDSPVEEFSMISQTVEYALRAIVTIAQHDGWPWTAQQISKITQTPPGRTAALPQIR